MEDSLAPNYGKFTTKAQCVQKECRSSEIALSVDQVIKTASPQATSLFYLQCKVGRKLALFSGSQVQYSSVYCYFSSLFHSNLDHFHL